MPWLHSSSIAAVALDMAVELGVCAAYLAIGHLIRRAGLLADSDTQASALGIRMLARLVDEPTGLMHAIMHGNR